MMTSVAGYIATGPGPDGIAFAGRPD